jgi:ABC-type oligopeptide transport system ATPase subunit
MYFGEKVEESETEKLFSNPQHQYTKTLLSSILPPDPRQRSKEN